MKSHKPSTRALLLASLVSLTAYADVPPDSTNTQAALNTAPNAALKILLSNDDGLTENIKALQFALVAAGHQVVVAVPCQNQSGKSASASYLTPIADLTKDCRGAAAKAGAPGVGEIAAINHAFYVDGTPIMATLYGLDVAAIKRWNSAPDLVISGPNEGQNLGRFVIVSGTVSNAQIAMSRHIPTIAVSADMNTTDNAVLAKEAADLTVKLLTGILQNNPHPGQVPSNLAINVNYPKFAAGGSAALLWHLAHFGNYEIGRIRFVEDLGADPAAASFGLSNVHKPGISFDLTNHSSVSTDTDPDSEGLLSSKGYATVTPMQQGYEVASKVQTEFEKSMRNVLRQLKN